MTLPSDSDLKRGETLASRLERGPLSLPLSIRYAYNIARSLRELHKTGTFHGAVNCRHIHLGSGSAVLLPAPIKPANASAINDIRGFGWVLRALFPDESPLELPVIQLPGAMSSKPRLTPEKAWFAARRALARCLADPPDLDWSMQKALNEFRLLDLICRQWRQPVPTARITPQTPQIWRRMQTSEDGVARHAPTVAPSAAPPQPAGRRPTSPIPAWHSQLLSDEPPEPQESDKRCPRCGMRFVHPSTPQSDFEETLELLRMPVLRCHRCSHRFVRILFLSIPKGSE